MHGATMNMEGVCYFETMVNNYAGTQRHNSHMDIQNGLVHGPEPFNTNERSLV